MSKHRTRRVYYGPDDNEHSLYWDVEVRDATRTVRVNGELSHALRAHKGVTIGCAISITAQENPDAFPHKVLLASVTKRTMIVIDKLQSRKKGPPIVTGVLYYHAYPELTEMNDDGTLKKLVQERPDLIARQLTFTPPPDQSKSRGKHTGLNPEKKPKRPYIPRGALGRAVRAGIVKPGFAEAIIETLGKTSAKK